MLIRKCLLAMLILMRVILMQILMLVNLNIGYANEFACLSYIEELTRCVSKLFFFT